MCRALLFLDNTIQALCNALEHSHSNEMVSQSVVKTLYPYEFKSRDHFFFINIMVSQFCNRIVHVTQPFA